MTESQNPSPLSGRPVFIVRLWWEPVSQEPGSAGEWRGSVELLASNQKHYFRNLSEVNRIIAAALSEILPSTGPP